MKPALFYRNDGRLRSEERTEAEYPCETLPPDAVDSIWKNVRDTAADVAARESLLRQRLQRLILDRPSLADSISTVLSDRLASVDMSASSLHGLMNDILNDEETILLDIVTDMHALKNRDPACMSYLHGLLNMKGFHALQTYRIAHSLWKRDRKELAFILSNKSSVVFCVDIHPAAHIGSGVMLDHGSGIVIGETAVVDNNVSILQNVTLGGTGKERGDRHPKVRYGVMIGAGAKILGNIEIGAMSKVAAGSVVLEAVPSHCTVAGVPAKVVRWHRHGNLPALDMDQSVKN